MTQLSKRSLRERRAPKSFDSDNEEQDPWGYAKPSYAKEHKNPVQQLGADARLLVKFLATVNKSYKEFEAENRKREIDSIREPVPLRERKAKTIENESELQRRQREASGELRADSSKKVKEAYNFKAPGSAGDSNAQRAELVLKKCKALNSESASKMLSIQSSLSKTRQPAGREAAGREGAGNSFKKGGSAKERGEAVGARSEYSFFAVSKEKQERAEELAAQLNIAKPAIAENKIFKRSAFHVAIAYHIYLNKLRERGSIGGEIDPTFYARRLKEGMHKS